MDRFWPVDSPRERMPWKTLEDAPPSPTAGRAQVVRFAGGGKVAKAVSEMLPLREAIEAAREAIEAHPGDRIEIQDDSGAVLDSTDHKTAKAAKSTSKKAA